MRIQIKTNIKSYLDLYPLFSWSKGNTFIKQAVTLEICSFQPLAPCISGFAVSRRHKNMKATLTDIQLVVREAVILINI